MVANALSPYIPCVRFKVACTPGQHSEHSQENPSFLVSGLGGAMPWKTERVREMPYFIFFFLVLPQRQISVPKPHSQDGGSSSYSGRSYCNRHFDPEVDLGTGSMWQCRRLKFLLYSQRTRKGRLGKPESIREINKKEIKKETLQSLLKKNLFIYFGRARS